MLQRDFGERDGRERERERGRDYLDLVFGLVQMYLCGVEASTSWLQHTHTTAHPWWPSNVHLNIYWTQSVGQEVVGGCGGASTVHFEST